MDSLAELFCFIDDFCQEFEPIWNRHLLASGQRKRHRSCSLALSELMTLVVLFHQVRHRQFKLFYVDYVCRNLRAEFPGLPSYGRMVELLPRCAPALAALFGDFQTVIIGTVGMEDRNVKTTASGSGMANTPSKCWVVGIGPGALI